MCSILAFLDVSTSGIGMYLFLFQMYLGAIILLVFSFNKILLIKTLMDFGDTVGNVSIVKGMKNILNITYLSIPCLIAYIPANFAIFLNFVPCASYGSCGNLDKPLLYIIVLWGTYMGLFIIPKLYAYKIIQKGVVDLTVQFEISASLIQNSFKLILNGQRFVTIFPPIYWKFIRGFKQINLEFMRFVNQKKIYN